MENKVWVILRPHYSPEGNMEKIGICGTGFFIKDDVFISSYHCLNESSFIPNSEWFNKNIFILNSEGKKIEITKDNIYKSLPEIDVISIKVDKREEPFELEENYLEKDEIKNIGYPEKFSGEIIDTENIQIKKQFDQSGKILKIKRDYSIKANDVEIFNKEVMILDYVSERGFSGGPLLKNNKVIGIISHLYPQNKNVVAISIKEIKKHL